MSTELDKLCYNLAVNAKKYYSPVDDDHTPWEDWEYDQNKDIIIKNWDKLDPKWQDYYENPDYLKSSSAYTLYKELPK